MPRGIHLVPRGWGRDPAGGDDHAKVVGHRLTAAANQDTHEWTYDARLAVPEPATASALLCAVPLLLARRRR